MIKSTEDVKIFQEKLSKLLLEAADLCKDAGLNNEAKAFLTIMIIFYLEFKHIETFSATMRQFAKLMLVDLIKKGEKKND